MDILLFILAVYGLFLIPTLIGAGAADAVKGNGNTPKKKTLKALDDDVWFFKIEVQPVSNGDFVYSAYRYKNRYEAHVMNSTKRFRRWVKASSEEELKEKISDVFNEWKSKEPNRIKFFLQSLFCKNITEPYRFVKHDLPPI